MLGYAKVPVIKLERTDTTLDLSQYAKRSGFFKSVDVVFIYTRRS